ncbi:MAG: hypothetical protein HKO93_05540, partial [Flavobacteriales bacterium]|nr:hypothetical protein [Flavobacteriales bacterium]
MRSITSGLLILGSMLLFVSCGDTPKEPKENETEVEEVPSFEEIIWNVKAIHPDGQTINVKAFDELGNPYDIKAIQNSDQDSFLDVRALVEGKKLPVKMLVSDDLFAPVKAIDQGGSTYTVRAITDEGEEMDVKGIERIGSIVIMRAVSEAGDYYAIKAISPEGKLNDIKGIKINAADREMSLHGLSVHAHIKAMHQSPEEENFKAPKIKRRGPYK